MKRRKCWYFQLQWLLLSFYFFWSLGGSLDRNDTPADSLDSTIREHAFKVLVHRRTGIVYDVPVPPSLSGMKAAVVRMRSSTLWVEGVSIRSFRIPPRTFSVPPVRRLIIVYQDLGNWSTTYYTVHNYSLATPILGLLAYDASGMIGGNTSKLDFTVRGHPIAISFPKVDLPEGMNSTMAKCMTFGAMGSQLLYNMTAKNECSAENGGHFLIVAPKEKVLAPEMEMKKRKWAIWVIASGIGVVGLIVLCLAGMAITMFVKKKRVEEMGRKAEGGEVLETVWVSGSKMPSASMVRTQPVLENGSAP